jgi:hypothetical protein
LVPLRAHERPPSLPIKLVAFGLMAAVFALAMAVRELDFGP